MDPAARAICAIDRLAATPDAARASSMHAGLTVPPAASPSHLRFGGISGLQLRNAHFRAKRSLSTRYNCTPWVSAPSITRLVPNLRDDPLLPRLDLD
jgi:hypothetical protein